MSGNYDDCKELEEKYLETSQQLKESEKLNKSKSYFLAQASHDLRQPLHALRIFINLLEGTKLSRQQQNLVDKLDDSVINMQALLDNYLDLSRLDYGGIKYEPEFFCLKNLTDKLAGEFCLICQSHHRFFHYIPCSLKINSDPVLLERLLRNLLSNAVKYSKHKIVFGCKRRKDFVQIVIMDDGNGIDEQDTPYIFDEFYQSGLNPDNRKSGAGLGLAIAKKIANLIGTDIRVRTKPQRETCFSFRIPATPE